MNRVKAEMDTRATYLSVSIDADAKQLVVGASNQMSGIVIREAISATSIAALENFHHQLGHFMNELRAFNAFITKEDEEAHASTDSKTGEVVGPTQASSEGDAKRTLAGG